jgi:hypothetical protein
VVVALRVHSRSTLPESENDGRGSRTIRLLYGAISQHIRASYTNSLFSQQQSSSISLVLRFSELQAIRVWSHCFVCCTSLLFFFSSNNCVCVSVCLSVSVSVCIRSKTVWGRWKSMCDAFREKVLALENDKSGSLLATDLSLSFLPWNGGQSNTLVSEKTNHSHTAAHTSARHTYIQTEITGEPRFKRQLPILHPLCCNDKPSRAQIIEPLPQ